MYFGSAPKRPASALAEVNRHLLCHTGVHLKMFFSTPINKAGDDPPVLQLIPLCNTANNGCVI